MPDIQGTLRPVLCSTPGAAAQGGFPQGSEPLLHAPRPGPLPTVHVLPQLRGNLNAQLSISRIRVHGADRGCIRVGKVIEVSPGGKSQGSIPTSRALPQALGLSLMVLSDTNHLQDCDTMCENPSEVTQQCLPLYYHLTYGCRGTGSFHPPRFGISLHSCWNLKVTARFP